VLLEFSIGNLNLLEMLFRIRPQGGVVLIEIGMPLLDPFAIGLFDLDL
jgi:tryptophan synthase alpha subunit